MRRIASCISLAAAWLCAGCSSGSATGDYPARVSIAYAKSLCTSPSVVIRGDMILTGRVVATDKLSEFSRCAVVDDGSGGIEIAVDSRRIDVLLPLYCQVTIHCNMLALGDYGGKIVLGAPPTGVYCVDRIAERDIDSRFEVSLDAESPPEAAELRAGCLSHADISRYAMFDRLAVVEQERGMRWCDTDPLTHRFVDTCRRFVDEEGDTLSIFTPGDAEYAGDIVPEGRFRAYGIVDYFNGEYTFRISNYRIIEY